MRRNIPPQCLPKTKTLYGLSGVRSGTAGTEALVRFARYRYQVRLGRSHTAFSGTHWPEWAILQVLEISVDARRCRTAKD
jgi:hypothetical protein